MFIHTNRMYGGETMARNKFPEETIKRILEVSFELFMEKGYENTSIQDIINKLGDLTKGAIYYHFKSKEEILMAVADASYKETEEEMCKIRDNKTLNGLEKLKKIFYILLESPHQYQMLSIGPQLLKNPKLLTIQLQGSIEEFAPLYIQPILEQGIKDGSIQTEYSKEFAEVVTLLINIWLNPMVFKISPKDMLNKCKFFREILVGLGVDLFDEQMINYFVQYVKYI